MELYGDDLMEFFQRVEVANFEIASDAFSSFKVQQQQQQQQEEQPAAVLMRDVYLQQWLWSQGRAAARATSSKGINYHLSC
jgi:hypothetical protein